MFPVLMLSAGTVFKLVAVLNKKRKVGVSEGVRVGVGDGDGVKVGVCVGGNTAAVCVAAMAAVCAMAALTSTGAEMGALPGKTNAGAQANVMIINTANIGVRALDESI